MYSGHSNFCGLWHDFKPAVSVSDVSRKLPLINSQRSTCICLSDGIKALRHTAESIMLICFLNYFIFSEDKSHLLWPLKIRC